MEFVKSLSVHQKPVSVVRFSPRDGRLASAAGDGLLAIWQNGELLNSVQVGSGINDVSWSPDGKKIAVACDDGSISILNSTDGSLLFVGKGHINHAFCLSWNPSGTLLASGSFDESVRIWVGEGEAAIRCIPAHSDPVTSLDFSPDGSLLVTGSFDGLIRMWDHATGQCVRTIVDDDNPPVASVKFTPNGQYLLSSTLDSTIRLWSISPGPLQGKCIKAYTGHVNKQFCCPPLLLQNCILSGSEDGRILTWDVNTRQVTAEWSTGSTAPIMSIAYLEGVLATASLDSNDIKLWNYNKTP